MNFTSKEYSELKESAIQLVIKAEYIKRKFEQEYEDIEWFNDNWNLPLKKRNISTSNFLGAAFLSELIQIQYKKKLDQGLTLTKLVEDNVELVNEIFSEDKEWFHRMYDISCSYKICAPELAIPMDFKEFLALDFKEQLHKTHIPNFLENQSKYGFMSCEVVKNHNFEPLGVFYVDLLYSEYDPNKILIEIQKNLCLLRHSLKLDLTKKETEIMSKMPQKSDDKSTYNNSTRGKLFGLLQWDLDIQGKTLKEIRAVFRELNFLNCHNNGSCYVTENSSSQCKEVANCKSKIDNQRKTTREAIFRGQHVSTSSSSTQSKNIKHRNLLIPRDISYLKDGIDFYIP